MRGLEIVRGRTKCTWMASFVTRFTLAKRTSTRNATRVFAASCDERDEAIEQVARLPGEETLDRRVAARVREVLVNQLRAATRARGHFTRTLWIIHCTLGAAFSNVAFTPPASTITSFFPDAKNVSQ